MQQHTASGTEEGAGIEEGATAVGRRKRARKPANPGARRTAGGWHHHATSHILTCTCTPHPHPLPSCTLLHVHLKSLQSCNPTYPATLLPCYPASATLPPFFLVEPCAAPTPPRLPAGPRSGKKQQQQQQQQQQAGNNSPPGQPAGGEAGEGKESPEQQQGHGEEDGDDVDDGGSEEQRRRRRDAGQHREKGRAWTDDEEERFRVALESTGRDWKACRWGGRGGGRGVCARV